MSRRYLILAALILMGGCVGRYQRIEQPKPLEPNDRVRIWSHGRGFEWTQVVIRADSVTGIPYNPPMPVCDNCPQSIARSDVDSILRVDLGYPVPHILRWPLGLLLFYAIVDGLISKRD